MAARFPSPVEELAIHQRIVAGDPVGPVVLYERFMDPANAALKQDLRCTDDEAYDSAVDAVLIYLDNPSAYDSSKGRLSTYLVAIAKRKAIDRLRARIAERKREVAYAEIVELQAPDPKEEMEITVEARQMWNKVETEITNERDRVAVRMILAGERSTDVLAEALGITGAAPDKQAEVKRSRDRLLKILERLGVRLRHDRNS